MCLRSGASVYPGTQEPGVPLHHEDPLDLRGDWGKEKTSGNDPACNFETLGAVRRGPDWTVGFCLLWQTKLWRFEEELMRWEKEIWWSYFSSSVRPLQVNG